MKQDAQGGLSTSGADRVTESYPPRPVISVVIATHRRPDRIARLLHSLASQSIPADDFEVIVIDDCSGDNTGDVLASLAAELPYRLHPLRTVSNRGPGPARNLGWRAASAPFVAFTDDDCVPDRGWLVAGLDALRGDAALGLVQGQTVPEDLDAMSDDRWMHSPHFTDPTPYFETCNIFYRRAALEQGGGFGEDYNWWGGWYCEDTYAAWRAIDAGWSRGFTSDAVVTHDVSRRDVSWWINKSLVLCNEVAVARKHPGFREEAFWRPWAPRRWDAAFVAGTIGLGVSLKWRPAALLALPYMWLRHPSPRQPHFLRRCVETVAVDSARTAGLLYGSIRQRILVI